jgi:hypothetical protein
MEEQRYVGQSPERLNESNKMRDLIRRDCTQSDTEWNPVCTSGSV